MQRSNAAVTDNQWALSAETHDRLPWTMNIATWSMHDQRWSSKIGVITSASFLWSTLDDTTWNSNNHGPDLIDVPFESWRPDSWNPGLSLSFPYPCSYHHLWSVKRHFDVLSLYRQFVALTSWITFEWPQSSWLSCIFQNSTTSMRKFRALSSLAGNLRKLQPAIKALVFELRRRQMPLSFSIQFVNLNPQRS